jgi:hypothetical protein
MSQRCSTSCLTRLANERACHMLCAHVRQAKISPFQCRLTLTFGHLHWQSNITTQSLPGPCRNNPSPHLLLESGAANVWFCNAQLRMKHHHGTRQTADRSVSLKIDNPICYVSYQNHRRSIFLVIDDYLKASPHLMKICSQHSISLRFKRSYLPLSSLSFIPLVPPMKLLSRPTYLVNW